MTLENNINYMNQKVWRCMSKLKKHDIKKIIREKYVVEFINISLLLIYLIYFLIFCFNRRKR